MFVLCNICISSVESQKGIIAVQRCCVDNQKGAIAVHTTSVAIAPYLHRKIFELQNRPSGFELTILITSFVEWYIEIQPLAAL